MRPAILLLIGCCGVWGQEFEVASIKASPPPGGGPFQTGCPPTPGFFICQNTPLSVLVAMAYRVPYYRLIAPGWMQQARFAINAKMPEGATREQLNTMLRNLLADRFKLVVHQEARDSQKYELVVAKNGPKFKEAGEPAQEAPAGPITPRLGDDGFPVLPAGRPGMVGMNDRSRWFQPQCTMSTLAEVLSIQLARPVTDATNLRGKYDMGLYWVSDRLALSDGGSGPSLMQAVQDQLGLRLEPKKGPVEFLVVDHMEKTPTEN